MNNEIYTIGLNNQFEINSPTYFHLLESLQILEQDPCVQVVRFDFGGLRFVKPEGLVVLANSIQWLVTRGYGIEFWNCSPVYRKWCPIRYLADSGFFETFKDTPGAVNSGHIRSTTFPLKLVSCSRSTSWNDELKNWLAMESGRTKESMSNISMCIGEIFNNITDHATTDVGCAFAQFFPQEKRILVSVADFGIGIPNLIKQFYEFSSDNAAILKAIEREFTTKSQKNNRGFGLDNLVGFVVDNGFGNITIVSGKGIVKIKPISHKQRSFEATDFACSFPGTMFVIEINVGSIPDNDEEDQGVLEW